MSTPPGEERVPWIAHDAFRAGWRQGRFRVVVNPALARPYVMQRLHVNALSLGLIGAGAVTAFGGWAWTGLALVVLGVAVNRLTRQQAAAIALRLAERDEAVYRELTQDGIVEVRRAEGS